MEPLHLRYPTFYVFVLFPHIYSTALNTHVTNGHFDNVSPCDNTFLTSMQNTVPAATHARYEGAKAAHLNTLENYGG